jgi:predicted ribosomally synthesized peptide with nif11-like leader
MEKMQELFEKVSKDVTLQKKFAAIIEDAEAEEEATKKKLINFAKDLGYNITIEEILNYFKELSEDKEGELSDAELDMVAGGKAELDLTRHKDVLA